MEIKSWSNMAKENTCMGMVVFMMAFGMRVRCKALADLSMLMEMFTKENLTVIRLTDMENMCNILVKCMKDTGLKTSLMVRVSKFWRMGPLLRDNLKMVRNVDMVCISG